MTCRGGFGQPGNSDFVSKQDQPTTPDIVTPSIPRRSHRKGKGRPIEAMRILRYGNTSTIYARNVFAELSEHVSIYGV